jgi:threonine aldolase
VAAGLRARGVAVLPGAKLRLVTHLDVSAGQIDEAVAAFGEVVG